MGNNPLVQPDPGLFIWTIVTFLVLVALLAKFAWRPLLTALDERQASIKRSLDDAQKAKQELERIQQESAAMLRDARIEAESIISKTQVAAERLRDETKQKARSEADAIIRDAQRQIELETRRAVRQIRNETADLAVQLASKLIQRNITREDNERLIDDALQSVEQMRGPDGGAAPLTS
jgi:F-type H+-transporting ATPase subunit b